MDPVTLSLAKTYADAKARSAQASGLIWPSGLIAFWDFSEPGPPYYSKQGVAPFPLTVGGTAPTPVDAEPFGKGLMFNGSSDWLKIDADNVGALNVAKAGDEVTVIAWMTMLSSGDDGAARFVAGMWQEDNNNPKRQYGLFYNLPVYGGGNSVCGHVSKTGGPSPGLPYSRDYSASGARIMFNKLRCIGFTYDGHHVRSYMDGFTDLREQYTEPGPPTGEGLTYSKNPYAFDLGLNRSSVSDFTVGAVRLTSGMGNFASCILSGLAVFNRALPPQEMLSIHLQTSNDRFLHIDFQKWSNGNNAVGHNGLRAWKGATDWTWVHNVTGWTIARLESGAKPFAFVSSEGASANYWHLLSTTGVGGFRLGQVSKADFTLNNKGAGYNVRFCLQVEGTWYATNQTYTHPGNGVNGSDWSTEVRHEVEITRDKSHWVTLTEEHVPGNNPESDLPNGKITAIGMLAEPLTTQGIVRLGEINLYR